MWKWMLVLCVSLSAGLHADATKMLALAGSTSVTSVNKKLVAEAATVARELGADVTLIDLTDYPIPFYDAGLETKEGMPTKAKELRQLFIQSRIILIASPEYNSSISAVLKNIIDWASRSENGNPSYDAFKEKIFVIMSASPGAGGGARGLAQLRTILTSIGGVVLAQQMTVSDAYHAFDEQGKLKNPKAKEELTQLVKTALQD